MDWQIKLDWHAEKPQVVSSVFNDEKMNLCMVDIVEALDFPAPPGDRKVYVSHTFLFKKTAK